MRIFIITGISGSGKSVALNALEDAGYDCVDNLPVSFIHDLAESLSKQGREKLAIAVDARRGHSIKELPEVIDKLNKQFNNSGDIISYDILNMYGKINEEIRNIPNNQNDYRTYPLLWQNLFKNLSTTKIDKTQIIDLIMDKIQKNIDNQNIIKLSSDALKLLIFDIDNYFTLPQNSLEDNYVLNRIYEIIVHIVKNIMCINLYHILIKLIRAEIINNIPNRTSDIQEQ